MRDKRFKSEFDSGERVKEGIDCKKKLEMLSELTEDLLIHTIIFDYDSDKDVITFMRPVCIQKHTISSIEECRKVRSWIPYIHPKDIEQVTGLFSSPKVGSIEFRCLTKEGYQWFKGTIIKARIEDNSHITYYGKIVNMNNEKKELLKQEVKNSKDELTGLHNLTYMRKAIHAHLNKESNINSSMILVRLLKFKEINQQYGYLFGDYILTQIAKLMKSSFQRKDLIARVGPDLFMIYIKDASSREDMIIQIGRFCKKVASIYTGYENDILQLVLGVAICPQDGNSFDELFQHADLACYVAKNRGYGNLMFYENCKHQLKTEDDRIRDYYEICSEENLKETYNEKIAAFALEVIHRLKDVNQVIVVLLNYLVNVLNVDYARIYEVTKDHKYLKMRYSSGNQSMLVNYEESIHQGQGLLELESSFVNGYLQVNCTSALDNFQLKQSFYERGIYSTLQFALYKDGFFSGCIALENNKEEHVWTKEEYCALFTITSILSNCLLKIHDLEHVKCDFLESHRFDQLTQLPLSNLFVEEAKKLIDRSNENCKYAIVSINFIHFKYINDTFGYDMGNQLLYQYARMLELTEDIVLASREVADSFLLCIQYHDLQVAKQVISDMNEEFSLRYKEDLNGWNLYIKAGICEVDATKNINDAIDKARFARKNIAKGYKVSTSIYDMEMHKKLCRKRDIIQAQEYALKNHEFEVHLQPKIALDTNQLVGAEALIRWNRSNGQQMFPDEFISVFEENGFIVDVDFFVYETVCQLIRRWKLELHKDVPISVNVSRLHLDDANFVEEITNLVHKYEIPTNLVELELTETMVLDDVPKAISMMHQLHERGFLVSIDDFGSGYSSLNLLKDLKTDILKLDREFFRQGDMKQQDKIILCNIIHMAKQLNMKVLSEGVETKKQSQFLKENACDMAQGYLYARPMPVAKFEQFLTEDLISY